MRARAACLGAALLAVGCSDGSPPEGTPDMPAPLELRAVDWNPGHAMVGTVTGVAEFEGGVVVFARERATVFVGGVAMSTDTMVHGWHGATSIPAADGSGRWVVALDDAGRVQRLAEAMSFEDVSDRYGLGGMAVSSVAELGQNAVGFGYAGGLAVSDGMQVTRYDDGSFAALVGGGGRIAGAADAMVRLFDPRDGTRASFPLPGVTSVTFDAAGRLVAATDGAVYWENDAGELQLRYRGAAVHGLARAGERVWFATGTELGTLEGPSVYRTRDAGIPADAALAGSPSGDVWAYAGQQLFRYARLSDADAARVAWERDVRPVFVRACSRCHLPGGTANLDLSNFEAWQARRRDIHTAVTSGVMPPAGNAITDADRAVIVGATAP